MALSALQIHLLFVTACNAMIHSLFWPKVKQAFSYLKSDTV